MKSELYVHFHPDEQPFVDRALEWVERAANHHERKRTDFLDPRQSYILATLANRNPDVAMRLDGGYPEAERCRAILGPDYMDPEAVDAGIEVLAVSSGDNKFLTLDHGDYMGAILGLGIKREKIGDIHVHETGCHCVVASEIGAYLHLNLNQVHRKSVTTELLPISMLQPSSSKQEEKTLTVASLRLDVIAGDVFGLSRAKALIPIKGGRVRVNWKTEEDPSVPLEAGDMISITGFGRFRLLEVDGVTKKGRIRIKIGKFI